MTPGWVMVGSTPARTSEDLPHPLGPKTRTNAFPWAAWRTSLSLISPIALVRPKKTGACSTFEDLEPPERRALMPDDRRRYFGPMLRQLLLDQLAKVLLQ